MRRLSLGQPNSRSTMLRRQYAFLTDESKIEQLRHVVNAPYFCSEYIGGLQVAVNEAELVNFVQRAACLS